MTHNSLEQQFEKAYHEFSDAIFRHCFLRVSDREQAKDIMQETFMKAWHFVSGGNEVENMKAFLYKVANNLVIDFYRKRKDNSLEALQEAGFDPGIDIRDNLFNNIESKRIAGKIQELEPLYRQALTMRYLEDLSPKDIANVVGETENVISVRIHRGIKKLKMILEKEI
ncbi:MAG TPA: RNA polymerase sigma factor [Candidatus Paceibacterota bacterium]